MCRLELGVMLGARVHQAFTWGGVHDMCRLGLGV